jgi:urease accessory protein
MAMTTGTDGALLRLLAWLSPSFPVGAFSYSHGLEWMIEAGDVIDRASLEAVIRDVLSHGAGRSDAIFAVAAHHAISTRDDAGLTAAAELAAALQPTKERALESHAQGAAFLATASAAWPAPGMDRLTALWDGPVAYPIAVGVVAAAHGVPRRETVLAYLHALSANLISAGVRAIPLGQTDGQRLTAALEGAIVAAAEAALSATLDDVGGAGLRLDIASMRHETQYTRLFRS